MIPDKIRVNLTFVVQFFVARAAEVTLGLFLLCGGLGILAYMMSDSSILVPEANSSHPNAWNAWDSRIEPIATALIPFLAVGGVFFFFLSGIFTAAAISSNSQKGMMRKVGVPNTIAAKILRDKEAARRSLSHGMRDIPTSSSLYSSSASAKTPSWI
jgi:hypothetical protein